jgi:GT2 family glycosyltransferase
MTPPLVCFVTWNRMGLNIRNIRALLSTESDFELHLIDNNSSDDSWSFIQDLKDERIKSKTLFEFNRGPVYAANYALSKRRKDQYFITVDSDVNIHTKDWIDRFLRAFDEFPDLGLLGAVSGEYYNRYRLPLVKREKNQIFYLQLVKGFVEGCCQCLQPRLIEKLGYWSEETCLGDAELCWRILNHSDFKAGFIPDIEIDQMQAISCEECEGNELCTLKGLNKTCFEFWREKYKNPQFRTLYGWKFEKFANELENGKRSVFCASIHDNNSLDRGNYDRGMADENLRYYINNAN